MAPQSIYAAVSLKDLVFETRDGECLMGNSNAAAMSQSMATGFSVCETWGLLRFPEPHGPVKRCPEGIPQIYGNTVRQRTELQKEACLALRLMIGILHDFIYNYTQGSHSFVHTL